MATFMAAEVAMVPVFEMERSRMTVSAHRIWPQDRQHEYNGYMRDNLEDDLAHTSNKLEPKVFYRRPLASSRKDVQTEMG